MTGSGRDCYFSGHLPLPHSGTSGWLNETESETTQCSCGAIRDASAYVTREPERHDLLTNYLKRLVDPNPEIHGPAARAWSVYEGSCSTLLPSIEAVSAFAQDRTAIGLARIEAHYFAHDLFLPEGGLLAHMEALHNIHGEIVQGRYDMICPAQSAFDLAAAWPAARLTLVPDAGHSALEPGVRRALLAALDRCRHLV